MQKQSTMQKSRIINDSGMIDITKADFEKRTKRHVYTSDEDLIALINGFFRLQRDEADAGSVKKDFVQQAGKRDSGV